MQQEYRTLRRFSRGRVEPAAPRRFAERLAALGPVFVKLGQIMSTRPDVLPPAYVRALAMLQEHGASVPIGEIRQLVERELGKPIHVIFATFDDVPVASASLSQVHRATLPDSTVVAVKVQRPGIERLMRLDLDAMQFGLQWMARLFPARMKRANLLSYFTEFRRYTMQELDFSHEADVIGRFCVNFEGRADVRFPQVHRDLTSHRVLTLDWIDGMRLSEVESTLAATEKQQLVRLLVDVLLQMFVSDGLFHADLHPGNIFFHPDGTFSLLDFGMYGELTAMQRDRFVLYWFAVVQRQTRRAFHHFKAQTRQLPGASEDAFYDRFALLAEKFYTSPLREMSFTRVYLEMMTAGYEHGFVFPSELVLHAKALTTAESLIFELAPDARFESLSRPFIAREYASRTSSLLLVKRRISQLAPELLLLGEFLPPSAVDEAWDWDGTVELFDELRAQFGAVVQRSLEHSALWQTLLARHATVVLSSTSLGVPTHDFLTQVWKRYYELEPSVPIEPNLGAVFTTHLAAATLAMHQLLQQHGVSAAQSHRQIYDIGWRLYVEMGEPPLLLASAFTRDPYKRLKLATDIFRAVPFGAPGYEWHDVLSDDATVAFDCTKCPVAEFFLRHSASELCVQTWCRLDFPLAEKWGADLSRNGTIASGAAKCDFKWKPRDLATKLTTDASR